jgi:hypothetical protein
MKGMNGIISDKGFYSIHNLVGMQGSPDAFVIQWIVAKCTVKGTSPGRFDFEDLLFIEKTMKIGLKIN